jgi:hypothetical protein
MVHKSEVALRYLMILTTEPTKAHLTYHCFCILSVMANSIISVQRSGKVLILNINF